MRRNSLALSLVTLSTCSVLVMSCTNNPFSSSKINPPDKQTIQGTVKLSDNTGPDSIFIWLEGVKLSTFTDESGKFKLQLPPPETQPGSGINGIYRLFYYVANYEIQTSVFEIIGGNFVFGQGELDDEGNIRETIILNKLIDIKTVIQPSVIREIDSMRLTISVFIDPYVNSVEITVPKNTDGWLQAMIFRKIDAPLSQAVLYGSDQCSMTEVLLQPARWEMGVKAWWLSPRLYRTLEPGEYEVIPYLRIIQDELPDALIKGIGEDADKFHYHYLKIPIKQEVGHLTVTE
jgi:hypothetical protein